MRSLIIAFSTYSKIPMPQVRWDEKSMGYSMCYFPLVGLVIGMLCFGCDRLFACSFFQPFTQVQTGILRGAVLTAIPLLVTGGIHMDGFLDTVDARSAYRSMEERLRILKDPHTGAFAIIYGMLYVLISFGLYTFIGSRGILFVALGYIYSRILSGMSVVTLKKAKKEGMLADTAQASRSPVKWILLAELFVCMDVYCYIDFWRGMGCILTGLVCFLYYRYVAYRLFGGVTGDLAGYFLQLCELWILIAAAVMQIL